MVGAMARVTTCLLWAGSLALVAGQQCTVTDPNTGKVIDLSSLRTSTYYETMSAQYVGYKFWFNVCGPITMPSSVDPDGKCPAGATSTCELRESDGTETATEAYGMSSTGTLTWNTVLPVFSINTEGPLYSSTASGGTCSGGGNHNTTVYFVCDANAASPVINVMHDDYYDCYVSIQFKTALVCEGQAPPPPGGQEGGSEEVEEDIGMILCILFFVFGILYLAGGITYNIKVKKVEPGYDAIPNKDFWVSLPGLIYAGWEFTKMKTVEFYEKHKKGGSGYGQL